MSRFLCEILCLDWKNRGVYGSIEKNRSKKDKKENKDKKEDQQKQQQKQSQQNEENMSKENAEQLLNAAMQDEKDTQERIRKAMAKPRQRKLEKQW